MSRLSRIALSKRSVTLLFAGALFIAGISAWGSLKQELLPDIDFPVITVVTPYPGAGSSDVTQQVTKPVENAIAGVPRLETMQSTSSNSISLVVDPVLVRDRRQGDDPGHPGGDRQGEPARHATPTVQALNINASPVVISSIASTGTSGLEEVGRIARTEIVPEIQAIEGVARADLTGGLEERVFITLDPAKLAAADITTQQIVGVLQANNLTVAVRPAPGGRLERPGLDDRHVHVRRRRSATSSSVSSGAAPAAPAPARGRGATASARVRPLPRVASGSPTPRPAPRRARRRSPSATLDRRVEARRDDRLRPDQRQPGAHAHRLEAVEREHGRSGRRGPGQARPRSASDTRTR